MPGGGVDAGESIITAGKRECMEEAAMEIEFKGWLALQFYPNSEKHYAKMMRFVLYAEPLSLEAANNPKNFVDKESDCAEWKTLAELEQLGQDKKLRAPDLLDWARYLEQGGAIYPMSALGEEGGSGNAASSASFGIHH